MATSILHLRVADTLSRRIPGIDATAFVFGCLGPAEAGAIADAETFYAANLEQPLPREAFSVCVGYYIHLLTEQLWEARVAAPARAENRLDATLDGWRERDALFLAAEPDFRPLRLLRENGTFTNTYLAQFPEDAFLQAAAQVLKQSAVQAEHPPRRDPVEPDDGAVETFLREARRQALDRLSDHGIDPTSLCTG